MLDIGVTKIAIIGAIALIVIGPEKLPGLARTLGTLMGRARAYLADVKAEVNRSMDLEALKSMKDTVENAARDVENSIQANAGELEKSWNETTDSTGALTDESWTSYPEYRHPKKHWRLKQGAMPNWYKARAGVRTKALSGAARVARFRPYKAN